MRRYFNLAGICAAFLALACLPALADSKDNFSNEKLTGNSGSTVSGSFTFNSTTDAFSNISLSFNGGVFNGINALDTGGGKATCLLGWCGFSWQTLVGNVLVWDTIVINVNTGAYQDFGGIYNWQNQWNFDPPMSAPEGASSLAYLALSGIAIFTGILVSEKKRRKTPAPHSV